MPDRGTTEHPLESKSAQTNGDRGWSRGAGCRRHRGARAGAERWRHDRAHADDLGARDDASGVLDGDSSAVDHASGLLPADDPARVEHAGDDVSASGDVVLEAGAAADHVDQADPARDHPAAPVDHLAAGVLLPRDDAAGVVVPGPLRSHR
ncbi:hypothetical protein GCM10022267_67420 [Lentzea roselyniae]|uniref:Uncharacterized protein n=1 Tax=Lentzea roselyniae TaxID=531940 RepID=A0ABP7BX80_9PSEU